MPKLCFRLQSPAICLETQQNSSKKNSCLLILRAPAGSSAFLRFPSSLPSTIRLDPKLPYITSCVWSLNAHALPFISEIELHSRFCAICRFKKHFKPNGQALERNGTPVESFKAIPYESILSMMSMRHCLFLFIFDGVLFFPTRTIHF